MKASPPGTAGRALLLALAWVFGPAELHAQDACRPDPAGARAPSSTRWQAPLDRPVTVDARDITLREALERVASAARIRFSYSPETVPLDRRVCVSRAAAATGDVLADLLRGTAVEAVATGGNLVVLAPARTPTEERRAAVRDSVLPLEPVIVVAHPSDPARRELPFVPGILEGSQLADRSPTTFAEALNGAVPGVWMWSGGSSGLLAQYGSIRGASSFGLSTPKVYIDGIEVANPFLLGRIAPDAIERVEVIRGPQGAALYGADAINGVTNITTRHRTLEGSGNRFSFRSGIGLSSTDFVQGSSVAQDHALGVRLGSDFRSAALDLNIGTAGEWIPGGSSRHVGANGSVRFAGSNSVVTGTLRFMDERTNTPSSPLLARPGVAFAASVPGVVGSRQYTAGIRAAWSSGALWTHTAVMGVDGYSLSGLPDVVPGVWSPVDSAFRAAGSGALRGTLRMSSAAGIDLGREATSTITLAAEHTFLRQFSDSTLVGPASSRSSTGVSGQADVALRERLFLTGGLRLEHNGTLESSGLTLLPMLGSSWLAATGQVTVKFRAAYGKAIRWPELPAGQSQWRTLEERFEELRLGPEVQSGVEGGFDVNVGRGFSVQVTRFDQTASGLVQRVAVANARTSWPGGDPYSCLQAGRCERDSEAWDGRIGSAIQSVGVIANRGWELQSSVRRGSASLTGMLSLTDSRVQRLAEGYTGDLRTGDRMLGVPSRTYGLAAAWTDRQWSLSLGVYGASDWMNYDAMALARAAAEPDSEVPVGPLLRNYWRRYEGVPHLRAAFFRDVGRGLALTVAVDNLLDYQVGEPDNITVQPGRTVSLGIRANF